MSDDPGPASPGPAARLPRALRWAPLLLPWAVFVVLGLRGLDFGKHWDEGLQRYQVQRAVSGRDLLPGQYKYPSLIVHLALAGATPDWVDGWGVPEGSAELKALDQRMREGPWLHRTRVLCLLFTSLALVGVYGALLAATGRWLPAWAGASALGASWELGYHARWVAPDGLGVAAGALVLWAAAAHLRRRAEGRPARTTALLCAAAVGLAAGAKYTGGVWLLVPLGLALGAWRGPGAADANKGADPGARTDEGAGARAGAALGRALAVGLAAAGAFLLITPGAVLEHAEFLRDLAYERAHYATGHYGHTVLPGLEHARLALGYLLREAGSPLPAVQALGLLLAAVGVGVALAPRPGSDAARARRVDRPLVLLSGLTVAVYLAYVTGLRVLFVRNLLLVLPAAALWVGLGVHALQDLARAAAARGRDGEHAGARVPAGSLVLVLTVAVAWGASAREQRRAADSIAADSPQARARALDRWIDAHPGARVYLTRELREQREAAGLPPRPEVVGRDPEGSDYVALVTGERRLRGRWAHRPDPAEPEHNHDWPSNRPGWAEAVFGPREVHWAYYTSWLEPHTIVLDREAYAELLAYRWRDLLPEGHPAR